jgi:hypothetical protein
MMWFWLNMPLAIVFFGAWVVIPLTLVLRNPDWGSAKVGTRRVPQPAQAAQASAAAIYVTEPPVEALALAGAQH